MAIDAGARGTGGCADGWEAVEAQASAGQGAGEKRAARGRGRDRQQLLRSRDLGVLAWVAEQGAARTDHVQALLGVSARTTRARLRRLRERELIDFGRILADEPAWLTPTARGLRACASPFPVFKPQLHAIRHLAAVNDVRIHVERRDPAAVWVCERELARDRGSRREHLPDALVLANGGRVAIEVELTVKSRRRLEAIVNELVDANDVVLYFCAPAVARVLSGLAAPGHWPSLGIRALPDPPGSAALDHEGHHAPDGPEGPDGPDGPDGPEEPLPRSDRGTETA